MTRAELESMLRDDFLAFDALESFTYVDAATAGNTSYTVQSCRKTFQIVKAFGQANVKGYSLESVGLTFPVANLTPTPKQGDTFTINSTTYEVVDVAKKTANTRWQVTGERAFIESDFATTCAVQRATLGVDVAGSVTEAYATTAAGVSCIVWEEPDVTDLINRLGIKADKQTVTFFMAQSVSVLPMDRILYNSRPYRITSIVDQGLVSRLLKVRTELYG